MEPTKLALDLELSIEINRPAAIVFEGLLAEFSEKMCYPDGRSMNMKLERFPGGRWYRDLGDNSGHLWGTIQSIKPPALLEITGQMFMSYPALNHLECKLIENNGVTRVTLRHRAIGAILKEHAEGVSGGWNEMLQHVKACAES